MASNDYDQLQPYQHEPTRIVINDGEESEYGDYGKPVRVEMRTIKDGAMFVGSYRTQLNPNVCSANVETVLLRRKI